jgi:hypothetical protein
MSQYKTILSEGKELHQSFTSNINSNIPYSETLSLMS